MVDISRRGLLCVSAASPFVGASAASAGASPDADLVRVCHAFAEAEFRKWWRYVTAPDDTADAQDREPDWATLEWVETTPATTPAGWHAKALALAAWNREAYDDEEAARDGATGLLAGLLRDMVAPARAEILARCAAEYGPLPEGYTADARWIGRPPVAVTAAPFPLPPHTDAELLTACAAYAQAEAEVARLERIDDTPDDVFDAAVGAECAAMVGVSQLRAHTVAGLRAKLAVCRTALVMDDPAARE